MQTKLFIVVFLVVLLLLGELYLILLGAGLQPLSLPLILLLIFAVFTALYWTFLLAGHRIMSFWLRRMVLKKSNWKRPQEEDSFIQEENTLISEPLFSPLPPWAFSSGYNLPAVKGAKFRQAEELPQAQTQIREPVSFQVGFSPLPD